MLTSVFINEFHYDNDGTDTGEFIEIAGPAGFDLTDWSIVLYNGSNGTAYDTDLLSGVLSDQGSGYGFSVINYPENGIQNGAPDGIALVDNSGTVVQFISYEGSFTAVGGSANGLTSIDIGVSESGSTPVGESLQLSGMGSMASDFAWQLPAAQTPGAANNSQTFQGGDGTPSLMLTADPASFAEDETSAVTVTRPADNTSGDLTVSLSSSDPGEATVPNEVTIPDGLTSATFTATGMEDGISDGTQNVVLTASAAGFSQGTANITVTDIAPIPITLISAVQGDGSASPIQGQTVTIEAVVVGDFQNGDADTQRNLQGFFVQEEDADADDNPLTSEGLFIFDGSSPALDVTIGDVVQVTGTVTEFNGLTELTNVTVSIEGTDDLPTAATVNFPVMAVEDLEAFEGMQVTIPDTLFVTEYFNLDRFGEVVLSSNGSSNEPGTDGRLDQYTDFNAPDQAGFAAYQNEIATRRIVLDDGQAVQNPDPIIHGRGGDPLSATNTLRGGDTVENLSGVLSFGFDEYRIQPVAPVDFQPTNPRPATPEDVGGDLTVASFNVLNFFTTLGDSGLGSGPNDLEPRGAGSQAEFDRQIEKLVTTLAIINADIFGLIELENEYGDQNGDGQFAIGTLVDALNNRVGAGTYAFVDPGVPFGDTGDAITVGAIYKTETVQIAPGTTVEFLTDSDLPSIGLSGTVFDGTDTNRAPLAVTFEEISSGETFTVSVNHFKSKGGSGSGDDADIGDGQGNFNGTRVRAAEAVSTWLATDPTGSGDEDFLIIGDLNAYAQEDPITYLEGFGYTNLIERYVGDEAYSFVFDGQFGYLDHGLANAALLPQVTGATEWHINADEPDAFDYNLDFGRDPELFNGQDPFRTSDHDPVIIGLNLESVVSVFNLTFGQGLNRLEMEVFQDGVLVERVSGSQNRPAPDAGPFDIFAVDSPDANPRRSNFVDRTFFNQGKGIGIADGDDSTPAARKRVEGDEILGISVTGFEADDALINLDRITSVNGAEILVEAYLGDTMIDSEVFSLGSVPNRQIQTLDFTSDGLFNTLQISAADNDTEFTFRSVELPEAFAV